MWALYLLCFFVLTFWGLVVWHLPRTMKEPLPVSEIIILTLKHRTRDLRALLSQCKNQGLQARPFWGTYGKELNPQEMTPSQLGAEMRGHVNALTYRGHLGASQSHLAIIREIADKGVSTPTIVFEDDVFLDSHFRERLTPLLHYMFDKTWDVLLIGWMCSYKDWDECHLNDVCIPDAQGIIWDLSHSIGLFGYIVKDSESAKKIHEEAFPMQWMVDLDLLRLHREGKIRIAALMPPIVYHPGYTEISSHGFRQYRPMTHYRSDTNK